MAASPILYPVSNEGEKPFEQLTEKGFIDESGNYCDSGLRSSG